MKRAVIVGALVLAAIFSAALITTSREQEPPKIQPRELARATIKKSGNCYRSF